MTIFCTALIVARFGALALAATLTPVAPSAMTRTATPPVSLRYVMRIPPPGRRQIHELPGPTAPRRWADRLIARESGSTPPTRLNFRELDGDVRAGAGAVRCRRRAAMRLGDRRHDR